MFLGAYDPHRHEFDPILQSWIYGGPKTRTFWEERNREQADAWCEYKNITREQGIAEMWAHQKNKQGKESKAIFVDENGIEHDIVEMMNKNKELSKHESIGQKIVKNDKAFQKLSRDLHLITTKLKSIDNE